MEVNVTIFIQALNFLMLFIFLSNALFKPLHKLYQERCKLMLDEHNETIKINRDIKKQENYIHKQTSLTIKKAKNEYRLFQKENTIRKKAYIKDLNSEHYTRYENTLLKLDNDMSTAKVQLLKDKDSIVLSIVQKLHEN